MKVVHSRTVESSGDGEKVGEFRPQETLSGSQGKDNLARSYFQETRNENHLDNHIFHGPSSASPSTGFAPKLVARSVSKDLALKRRISILVNDMGSIGPIGRLRQKTNLFTARNVSLPIARTPFSNRGTGIASISTLDPFSKTIRGSEDKGNLPDTSYNPAPSQSEDHVGALNENSPSKLMPNMLRGQTLKSLDDVNSLRILQGASYGSDYKQKGLLTDTCETSSSQKLDKVGENGTKSFSVSNGSLVPEGTGNCTAVYKDNVPAFSVSDSVKQQVATQSFPKKWGFRMSAHEDFLELDDEIRSIEASGTMKLGEGKKFSETSVVDSKAVLGTEDKTVSVSEFKAPTNSSDSGKPTGLGTSPSIVSVSESATFTKYIPDKEPNDDKVSPYTISFRLKSTASAEVKQETTNSLAARASDAIETVPKPADSAANCDVEEMLWSVPASTSSLFAVGSKPSFSSINNDSLKPTAPSIYSSSVPVLPTSNSGNQTTTNPFTGFAFSTTKSTAASSEATPSLSATPSSLFSPAFKFGSTPNSIPASTATPTPSFSTAPDFKSGSSFMAPPTYSTVSTTSSVTDVKSSTEKVTSLETDLLSNPFSPPSFQMAGTGSSVFGLSAGSPSSSTAASLSQDSSFGTTNGTSNSTQSVPVFASSATSTLGTYGSTPFSTGSYPFSFSTSSGPAFGHTTSSSFTFGSGSGSFSLGSGSVDKAGRRMIKIKRKTGRKEKDGFQGFPFCIGGFPFGCSTPIGPAFGHTTSSSFTFGGGSGSFSLGSGSVDKAGRRMIKIKRKTGRKEDGFQGFPYSIDSFPFGSSTPSGPAFKHTTSSSFTFGGGSSSFSLGSGSVDKAGRRMIKIKRKTGRKEDGFQGFPNSIGSFPFGCST